MQEVIIKIKGDSSDIVKLGTELKNLGKIDADNAKQFKKTNDDFKKGAKESKSALSEVLSEVTDIKGQLINLGKTIVATFAIESIVEFGKASIEAFQEAELNATKLAAAVKNIGGEGNVAFSKLIKQSEELQSISIFSDDSIQQAQTQLVQFGLTSKEVENLIPKILDLASATGTDLGQATDLVIQGINGQARALKPLGLEFKNTGDKAENLAIITNKLGKFQGSTNEILNTSTGYLANLANKWDDVKESIGGALLSLFSTKDANAVTKSFYDQANSVATLRDNILPLTKRYDELTSKSSLSKKEQAEVKKIVDEISAAIPGAVTQFDKYGNAIAVSTSRSREFVEVEINRLKAVNQAAIQEQLVNAANVRERIAIDKKRVDEITRTGKLIIEEGAGQNVLRRQATQQEIAEVTNRYKTNLALLEGYIAERQRLEGGNLIKEKEVKSNLGKTDDQLAKEEAEREKKRLKALEERKKHQQDFTLIQKKGLESSYDINSKEIEDEVKRNNIIFQARQQHIMDMAELEQYWADEKARLRDEDMKVAIATAEFTIGLGKTLVDTLGLQGKQAEDAQKAFALADITISTAKAIAALTASSTQVAASVAAASGPAGVFTGPAAYAAYYGTQIVTILANMLSAKQILGYEKGTPSLQRNGHPAGVDTIPVMANEGEAIIPTDKNRQNPGLAAAWIKGNLDDFINVKYVIPALKKNKQGKDDAFADRLGKAISLNGTFNDMNLLESDKENRRILRSIDKTLKSGSYGLSRRKF